MNKGEVINGFRILEDFRVAGGTSKVSFAEKDGKEYCIKEFLYPKYPTPESHGSERIKEQKRKACEAFESHHRKLNELIASRTAGLGGNLVYALDFFREGTTYYKINEKIDTEALTPKDISELPFDKLMIIAISVCHSIGILHDLNIVHGDLKPDNILIKETSRGNYSGKLIDFDDSYFSKEPPSDRDRIVGTPEYYSPELAEYIKDEEDEVSGETLTLRSDIFTLGIILTEYFTGDKPQCPKAEPVWKAVKDGNKLAFAKALNPNLQALLLAMLSLNPKERPNIKKVHQTLKDIRIGKSEKTGSEDGLKDKKSVRLRGRLLSDTIGHRRVSLKDKLEKKPVKKSKLRGKGLNIKG